MKIIFSKTDFFSKIFQSARNSHKVLPRTFKYNHKKISLMEILHVMLKHSEVTTYIIFFQIPTTTLELSADIYINSNLENITEEKAAFGMIMYGVHNHLLDWIQLTETKVVLIKDLN